jgi:hypothetical protein
VTLNRTPKRTSFHMSPQSEKPGKMKVAYSHKLSSKHDACSTHVCGLAAAGTNLRGAHQCTALTTVCSQTLQSASELANAHQHAAAGSLL